MADDITLNSGSGGSTLAADEISGVHHQRVKIQHGADGSATDVSSASPLPVTANLSATDNAVLDNIDTQTAAIQTAVEILDNAISGNEMQVDIVTGTVTANLSATDNAVLDNIDTQTAAIQTAVEILDNAISGSEMQVDVVGALPAGTNAIGKLAANSGVDIGDVDVTSCDGIAAEAAALGNGILIQGDDGTDRKNINVDATTGDVQVDVTNTVTVSATALDDIKTAVEIIDNIVSGSEAQVDVVTQPARAATTDTITAKLSTDAIQDGTTALTPKFAAIDAATSGDNTLVAAVAGKKIRVLSLFLVAAGTVTTRFEDGAAGTALTGQMNVTTNSGYSLPFNPVGWFETSANTLLNLELSSAVSVDGCLTYVEV